MAKFVPPDKMSKKARKEMFKNRRMMLPRTPGAHKSDKDYDRQKEKTALRRSLKEGDFFYWCDLYGSCGAYSIRLEQRFWNI